MARSSQKRQPAPDPRDELVQLALDLDLTAVAAALPRLLEKAEKEGLSFSAFTTALFREEADARKERKLGRSLRRSRLEPVEGLAGFDFSRRPGLNPSVVHELMGCEWVRAGRCIALVGKPGLGKTRVAKALVHAAHLEGYTTLNVVMAEMLEELHASLVDGTWKRALRRFVKPDVLLLDEFAYEPVDAQGTTYLFRVIAARYQKTKNEKGREKEGRSIVLTANLGFKKWKTLFPSEGQAAAAIDRLLHDATVLRFSGDTGRPPRDVHGAPLDDDK